MSAKVERMDIQRIPEYQKGGEGFIKFVEENVKFEVPVGKSQVKKWVYPKDLPTEPDPVTGKSYKAFWDSQKEELRNALEMKDGKFKYKVIVLCWMRGEGKSFLVVLIQLWKFFCFPRQLIVFGALSKDQTRFVHYDISMSLIKNSPKLLNVIGKDNVQHGRLFLKNSSGEITSSIQPISSFTGIVSNITGYTFSEMFDMKDSKFFVQLDGSTRNIHNSLGTIDSTVSTKDHILYQLYKAYTDGSDRLIYFSHREAPEASPDEFWHPGMDKEQLRSYRNRFPPADFDRYFRNCWELDSGKLFPPPMVRSVFYYGYYDKHGKIKNDDGTVLDICNEINELLVKSKKKDGRVNKTAKKRSRRTRTHDKQRTMDKLGELEARLVPVDDLYQLKSMNAPCYASNEMLQKLGEKYDTGWSIHAGIDRSDPMAKNPLARTIVTAVAKGLTNSKTYPNIEMNKREVPEYIYFLLHLAYIEDATLEGIKKELKNVYNEYDGIDTLCSERWGAWDLAPWCSEHEIEFEAIFPSFDVQKKAFTEMFVIVKNARFKSPEILVSGTNEANILREEMKMFDYDPQKKWYGSPQKFENKGIQDDSIFSLAWGVYGGREYGVNEFRDRKTNIFFGEFFPGKKTFANYDDERII